MGVALPLAIGVKRATPKTPLVAVVGDAGLDMAPGDLATLRDMHLPITIVALVDNSLTLIARKQAAMKMPEIGVDFGRTNFISLAAALRWYWRGNNQFAWVFAGAKSRREPPKLHNSCLQDQPNTTMMARFEAIPMNYGPHTNENG